MNKLCYLFFLLLVSFSASAKIDAELLESKKCSNMFEYFEKRHKLPQNTLHSISLQETQKSHSTHKITLVWPWTINVKGKGYHFDTKNKALAFARAQIAAGNKSIDVGCMQINLKYHPNAFASLEQAFSPRRNIAYGAQFLKDHYNKAGSWNEAIGRYHSKEQNRANRYQTSVRKISDTMTIYKQKLQSLVYNNQYKKTLSQNK
tara:strand:- start:139 stop:750 length:612 start_codon:yes stop_codon:yes gene_type:complete